MQAYIRRATVCLVGIVVSMSTGTIPMQPAAAGPTMLNEGQLGPQLMDYPVPDDAVVVAPDGEGEACIAAEPCAVETALQQAPSGATIAFRGGVYRVGDVQFNKDYTLQPYGDEQPILNGSQVVTDWSADGGDWQTTWTRKFPPGTTDEIRNAKVDMVWVDQTMLTPVDSRGAVEPGTFYFDYNSDQISIGTDPGGKTVEVTAHAYAFERVWWNLGGVPGGSDEKGVTVRGLTFTQYAQDGFWSRVAETVLENNVFTNNHQRGLITYRTDHIIRNNEISNNRLRGANFPGNSGILFEHNIVRGNSFEGGDGSEFNIAVKFSASEGGTIRHNLVEDNGGNGIWLDVGANGYDIVGNIARNNQSSGIFFEISDRATIAGNLLIGNNNGVRVNISSNGNIYNNTFVDNAEALHVVEYYRDDPDSNEGPGQAKNLVIKNNIFFNATSTDWPWALITVRSSLCGDWKIVNAMDYNAYHRDDPVQPASVLRWDNAPDAGAAKTKCENQKQTPYATLADFQGAESSYEANGIETSGDNPFFTDPAGGDYRLKDDSPAIGAGEPLPDDVAEALGWPAGEAVDLGAFQRSVDVPPPGLPDQDDDNQPVDLPFAVYLPTVIR